MAREQSFPGDRPAEMLAALWRFSPDRMIAAASVQSHLAKGNEFALQKAFAPFLVRITVSDKR